jgi:hypothetical protein
VVLLVIVNNLHIHRPGRSRRTLEANPPLVINADAVLSPAVSGQGFKSVAGQSDKISERRGGLKTIKLQASRAFDPGEGLDPISGGEVPGSLVAIADNHQLSVCFVMRYVQRISQATPQNPAQPSAYI